MNPLNASGAASALCSLPTEMRTLIFTNLGVEDMRRLWISAQNASVRGAVELAACARDGQVGAQLAPILAAMPGGHPVRDRQQQDAIAKLLVIPPEWWRVDQLRTAGLSEVNAQRLIDLSVDRSVNSSAPWLWETLKEFPDPSTLLHKWANSIGYFSQDPKCLPDERALLALQMVGYDIASATIASSSMPAAERALLRAALTRLNPPGGQCYLSPEGKKSTHSLMRGLKALGCDFSIGGMPALCACAQWNYSRTTMDALLSANCDVNDRVPANARFAGATALHFACANGNGEAMTALIAADADVNARDALGKTPFMWVGARHTAPLVCLRNMAHAIEKLQWAGVDIDPLARRHVITQVATHLIDMACTLLVPDDLDAFQDVLDRLGPSPAALRDALFNKAHDGAPAVGDALIAELKSAARRDDRRRGTGVKIKHLMKRLNGLRQMPPAI
ncbi:ankyrin repeat domain-containing protein [Pandoraea sp. PE-S2T-3]|uniref:ankyrin repeat domain-containing protein n=1 Tax=Pandoraea sp. PE-S2T-3 TaxID=1986993 RepID=UPI000B405674|nr:ankyrin repeat domain-containing protein [Pandoraea sp. PE-S2T-3]